MNDEPSIFKKYIADSLETVTDGPKNITGSLEKERQAPVEIKPRHPVAYGPAHKIFDPKMVIADILVNGPVPTTTVLQRGAERGLTRKQLWRARKQLKIVAFKDLGKNGCWFLALPNHVR